MTNYSITGGEGLEFLNSSTRVVARIVNRGGKWFATPVSFDTGVMRNTDVEPVEVTHLRNRDGGAALVASALGL